MITENTMYWITRLDNIKGMFEALAIVSGTLAIISTIVAVAVSATSCADPSDENKRAAKTLRRCNAYISLAFAVFGSAAVLTPTAKEFAVIKVVPMIANSGAFADSFGDLRSELLRLSLPTEKANALALTFEKCLKRFSEKVLNIEDKI